MERSITSVWNVASVTSTIVEVYVRDRLRRIGAGRPTRAMRRLGVTPTAARGRGTRLNTPTARRGDAQDDHGPTATSRCEG